MGYIIWQNGVMCLCLEGEFCCHVVFSILPVGVTETIMGDESPSARLFVLLSPAGVCPFVACRSVGMNFDKEGVVVTVSLYVYEVEVVA